ncbi:NADPH-dependent FMN reductase [Pseudonocardia humida]|uniref:NAD(P)H-dependent oxidoreductase n=1 Tax=Pseudonocardia humida TaxID=2800819 RepID=A0ABT0ZRU5_9PSEU|nr:NADPH-dependent FMN reductase [Pseudonocardia humida]MCO1653429.1 NAD(P)H-dependent oxidoreductase [Pseudonocardia humida]
MPSPDPARPRTVLGVAGSLRRASVNRALLAAAGHELPTGARLVVYDDLAALPPFDEDAEAGPVHPAVAGLRAAIAAADVLLVATPEYNASLPGVLKNALDWASRPHGSAALAGKPAAAVGAGPGPSGAATAQADLLRVLARAGAVASGGPLPVPAAFRAFGEDGRLLDPERRAALADLLRALCAAAGTRSGAAA